MDNDGTEADFACMSRKFYVHVEKYLFLNPYNSFHILAVSLRSADSHRSGANILSLKVLQFAKNCR